MITKVQYSNLRADFKYLFHTVYTVSGPLLVTTEETYNESAEWPVVSTWAHGVKGTVAEVSWPVVKGPFTPSDTLSKLAFP